MSGWSSVLPRLFRQGYFHQQQKGDDENGPLIGRAVLYHSTERNNNHENRNEILCAFWLFVRTIYCNFCRHGRDEIRSMWTITPLKILAIHNWHLGFETWVLHTKVSNPGSRTWVRNPGLFPKLQNPGIKTWVSKPGLIIWVENPGMQIPG